MHEYAAKHQVLVEESYARYSVKMDEYLRQRREEKRINWNNRKLMCDHYGEMSMTHLVLHAMSAT